MSDNEGTEMSSNSKMITIARRSGESLSIGDDVTVEVIGVKGNEVRLALNLPKEVSVQRISKQQVREEMEARKSKTDGG